MYCEVVRLSNTVSFPSVTVTESLVQVTVVAGPPSGDTGEGKLRTGSIEVRVHSECHTIRYCDVPERKLYSYIGLLDYASHHYIPPPL